MFCCGKHVKIEAEVCADPVWCLCGANLELDAFPLSEELTEQLWEWNVQYGEWLEESDYDDDLLVQRLGKEAIEDFNRRGKELAMRVRKELGEDVQVHFSPLKMRE
ncbi:hypothetical protein [Staphylospora marina]|uniref:hypothetical protein n=1 Tax=Staphylospora marina TaxID=2490858 RepID=UPI000F5BC6F0|nr:hypothetical protein [Staphylospora marina]